MTWNFGDILDALPQALPAAAPAFMHGDRTITWGETSRRSNNLARAILARGAKPGDKVASSITWNGRLSQKGCPDGEGAAAKAGRYDLTGRNGSVTSDSTPFALTNAD